LASSCINEASRAAESIKTFNLYRSAIMAIPTYTYLVRQKKHFFNRIEANVMRTTIRRQCVYVVAVLTVLSIYAAGAYRIEQLRQQPRMAVVCTFGHCAPTDASFSALR
jgi:hypothetical protein